MALNVADRLAVRQNIVPRCTVLIAEYANYLLGLGAGATEDQLYWARQAMRSPGSYGDQVSWYCINDPAYVSDGSGISDSTLQALVQNAVNSHYIIASV